jgi:hypothetical protein
MARPFKPKDQLMNADLRIPVTADQKQRVMEAAQMDGSEVAAWLRPVILRAVDERLAKRKTRKA